MIRARPSIVTQLAAVLGTLVLGLGGFIPFGLGMLWAQAPLGSSGQPYGASGIMPISPNSPNNPSNINPNMGSPVAPTQPLRPASWPGGTPDDVPAPTRKSFAAPFGGQNGAAPPGNPGADGPQPKLIANSAAGQPAASRAELKSPETTVFEGPELIAWVGSEAILAADVMYEVNKMMDRFLAQNAGKQVPAETLAQGRVIFMKQNLKRLIETKLLFLEAARNVPAEAIPKIEKQFNEQFDKMYLRKMMESENCGSHAELQAKLRRQGTTIDGMKRQAFEGSFAARWFDDHVKEDDEITHDDMRNYYNQHHVDYEKPRRLRWEHVMARYDKYPSKAEAYQAVAQWGNQILSGVSLAEIAKAHSNDPSAADGGVHAWTNEGSLRSEAIDRVLFDLPPDRLSQIIEDDRGFHIVRVIEREDTTCRPFSDVQGEIRKKIREERTADRRTEYLEKLRAKTPVWTIFDESSDTRTASGSAPSRR